VTAFLLYARFLLLIALALAAAGYVWAEVAGRD